MLEILLIRHGQSEGNLKGVFSGSYDYSLTENGIKQGNVVCEYIANNYKVAGVYSSKLKRAMQTVDLLSERTGVKNKPLKYFNELYGGKWENQSIEAIQSKYANEYKTWAENIGLATPTKGETWNSILKRAIKGLKYIAKDCKDKDGVAVVGTHGGIIRALEVYLKGLPLEKMQEIPWVSNCSITTIEYDGKNFSLKEVGKDDFLGNNKTFVPKGL